MKELVEEPNSPYALLAPYGHLMEGELPRGFLSVFDVLVRPTYLNKKFEEEQKDFPLTIDDLQVSEIKVSVSKEIVNVLNAHSILKRALEHMTDNFKTEDRICDSLIRSIETFSHYVVMYNLGLPLSNLDKSRSVECEVPRVMLYKMLESCRDVPQFIALLQTQWKDMRKSNHYHLSKDNKVMEVFIVPAKMVAEEKLARSLINKFREPRSFEENGVYFPERIYYCSNCRKVRFEKHDTDECMGFTKRHLTEKMKELSGIVLHNDLSDAFPYISEYLVAHTLRRLLSTDNLFGFLAHSVLFDVEGEEIDIIALVSFKNYVKIFPIEVQISSNINMKRTYEKFQKLENFLRDKGILRENVKIHYLSVTFEEPKERRGENFSICHFSELEGLVRNLILLE